MNKILFQQPARFVFGDGSVEQFVDDFLELRLRRLYLLTIPPVRQQLANILGRLEQNGVQVKINTEIEGEPTFGDYSRVLQEARDFEADSVVGIGGGSVMDVAKLVAAMLRNSQELREVIGIGLIKERKTYLACLPTTSGTGSEVSPNAIFLDETDGGKKGVISSFLMPDGAYIDPALTAGVPASVTAATGVDALTHCIEAYVNKFAHPMTDLFALEGIRLIHSHLAAACKNGQDLEARAAVARGSVYGGMCLGPVNTAAVHALAYPLGSEYKIAHGLSNALLLPYVLEYNMPEGTARLAEVAKAMGVEEKGSVEEIALKGIQAIRQLILDCGLPSRLSEINIQDSDLDKMAESAILVQRLLKNNVKELKLDDIKTIYRNAL